MRQFKKVLTPGISGSGESYLADYIVQNYHKVKVRGISKWHSTSVKKNLSDSINKIISKQDSKLFRLTDATFQIPNTTKFTKQTNWKPKYSFEESVSYLFNCCREYVRREKI